MTAKHWRILLLVCLGVPAAMLANFILVYSLFDGDWQPIVVEVRSTSIEMEHTGTPVWSLLVDISYEVDGRRYDKARLSVLNKDQLRDTEVLQKDWPAGKHFTVYYHPDDPQNVSLASDGGREVAAVVAAIATPALVFFLWLGYTLVGRMRASKAQNISG